MRVTVSPSSVSGTLIANPSKSHAQRAIAIASLCRGTSSLSGIGSSADVMSALGIASALGAQTDIAGEIVHITGGAELKDTIWHCGESGLCLRLFTPIAALYDQPIDLTGEGTLISRPVGFMAPTFEQLGVSYSSNEGILPVTVRGPFLSPAALVDGALGSQFLTGLLIALPLAASDTKLEVQNLKSIPYIDLTLATMREFGIHIAHDQYQTFHIRGRQQYIPAPLTIQGDWSGMAFLLVAAALAGEIQVLGLPDGNAQPDGRILEALKKCGADLIVTQNAYTVRHADLQCFEMDCTHCPDLFPPLVALAAHCEGVSVIQGVHRLRTKESDRKEALIQEFAKVGVHIEILDDAMHVTGGRVHGARTESYGDHRIAMAMATTALKASSPVTVHGAECVAKSYPGFFKDLATVGVVLSDQPSHDA